MDQVKLTVKEIDSNKRLDKYLDEHTRKSRNYLAKLIKDGNALVNNKAEKASYKVRENDEIVLTLPDDEVTDIKPANLDLNIVYQDDDVAVVDKPEGMVVHPGCGNYENTLVNGLLYELDDLSSINGVIRPGIVHRIDKDTSGLLMIAKNDKAHESLAEQLKNHTTKRKYVALVYGVISEDKGRIEAPIGRDKQDRKKMAVVENGKEAVTNFTVLKRYKEFTLIECVLETGRTHQIRVHLKYINHPLVGDPVYGPKKVIGDHGQFLHAELLGFVHPTTGEYMEFKSELPEYFKAFLAELDKEEL